MIKPTFKCFIFNVQTHLDEMYSEKKTRRNWKQWWMSHAWCSVQKLAIFKRANSYSFALESRAEKSIPVFSHRMIIYVFIYLDVTRNTRVIQKEQNPLWNEVNSNCLHQYDPPQSSGEAMVSSVPAHGWVQSLLCGGTAGIEYHKAIIATYDAAAFGILCTVPVAQTSLIM